METWVTRIDVGHNWGLACVIATFYIDFKWSNDNKYCIAFFFTESIYRHYFELEGDYISLDIMDTAGKVNHWFTYE